MIERLSGSSAHRLRLSLTDLLPSTLRRGCSRSSLYHNIGSGLRLGCFGTLLTKAHAFSQLGSFSRIVCGHHRVVTRQAPFLPVSLRGQTQPSEVPLERLIMFPVFQADQIVWSD